MAASISHVSEGFQTKRQVIDRLDWTLSLVLCVFSDWLIEIV